MMIHEETKLWKAIHEYDPDDPRAVVTFSAKLAHENGWSREYTFRTIHEYKKFMFLICATNRSLTPSDPVDQVWHMHLLYTREYWTDFCPNILGREIHHGPTKGGAAEHAKFDDWYALTLFHYRRYFGQPPSDIWPPPERRSRDGNFRRVDLNRHWVIKKIRL